MLSNKRTRQSYSQTNKARNPVTAKSKRYLCNPAKNTNLIQNPSTDLSLTTYPYPAIEQDQTKP